MSQRKEGVNVSLPEHYLEAEKYYAELRKNPQWLEEHKDKYLAIMGQKIVGQADNFSDLSTSVREIYGYGSIFMPHVTKDWPQVVKFRPRLMRGPGKQ